MAFVAVCVTEKKKNKMFTISFIVLSFFERNPSKKTESTSPGACRVMYVRNMSGCAAHGDEFC